MKSGPMAFEKWGREFFAAWDEWVYKLAPLAKDATWQPENEFKMYTS